MVLLDNPLLAAVFALRFARVVPSAFDIFLEGSLFLEAILDADPVVDLSDFLRLFLGVVVDFVDDLFDAAPRLAWMRSSVIVYSIFKFKLKYLKFQIFV